MQKQIKKFTLLLIFLLTFYAFPTRASYEISDGSIKSLWHFNGDLSDSSGNGHTGTNYNITYGTGKFASSTVYNGSSAYFTSSGINLTGDLTYSVWLNITSLPTSGNLMQIMTQGNSATEIYFWNNGGTQVIGFSPSGSINYTFPTGGWHLLTITNKSGTNNCKFWIDGTNVGSINGTNPISDTGNFLNGKHPSNIRYFNGSLDEMFVADTILSTSTISDIYNSGTGEEICTTAGCADEATTTPEATSTCALTSDTVDDDLLYSWSMWIFYFVFILFILAAIFKFLKGFTKYGRA